MKRLILRDFGGAKSVRRTDGKSTCQTGSGRHSSRPAAAAGLIGQQLRRALANGELYLNYQPQYNNKLGKIEAFEALLRWQNPVLGIVPPASFIKVAEESGLIIPIGEWVIRTACHFIRKIHQAGFSDCRIAVNVSVIQLLQAHFGERVLAILQETGLAPGYLELELTESLPQVGLRPLADKLETLQAGGIKIALDDFGTGYASLSCLNQLKVDTLKIDKSFIDGIMECKESIVLTKSIINIGRRLGLKVIAEGVENQVQVNRLSKWRCDRIQGYFYSKPVKEKEAVQILKNGLSYQDVIKFD